MASSSFEEKQDEVLVDLVDGWRDRWYDGIS